MNATFIHLQFPSSYSSLNRQHLLFPYNFCLYICEKSFLWIKIAAISLKTTLPHIESGRIHPAIELDTNTRFNWFLFSIFFEKEMRRKFLPSLISLHTINLHSQFNFLAFKCCPLKPLNKMTWRGKQI